jgi:glycerol-3-phosphate dehydrogenase
LEHASEGAELSSSAQKEADPFDILIIGGGINGAGIARDAAGRGCSVFLCEKGDLASATSSASTKLIHGGLRYLEYYEFRLVHEALVEREVLWGIAPHIIRPLRFVLPHHKGLRPAWLLRLGLFIYDHLGGRRRLPATRTLDLASDPAGKPLKPEYRRAFEYSDCWTEDARLVVLNARDAADKGAIISPRTRCRAAKREGGLWVLTLEDAQTRQTREVRGRVVVNAAGPWVADVLSSVVHLEAPAAVRLVKGSHIVVRRLYEHDRCYFFQNADRRIFFAIPFERNFTLIGTTDLDYHGDPEGVTATADEIDYLCRAASDYFRQAVTPDMVVWTYSGVRPLYDDGASEARAATRDYVLKLAAEKGQPPLLSVFGGKITTYRRLAEAALRLLADHLPATGRPAGWTAREPLPGGDFGIEGCEAQLGATRSLYPFIEPGTLNRLVRNYGTRVKAMLGNATSKDDLGRDFGAGLAEAELRYLADVEWAMTAQDVVWRRTKLGLFLSPAEIAEIDAYLRTHLAARQAAE